MKRPQSIIWFERLFFAVLVISLIQLYFSWSTTQATIAATHVLPSWYLPVVLVVSWAINLTLWYFIARRGSNVTKWIYVVLLAIGLIGVAASLFRQPALHVASSERLVGYLTTFLSVVSAYFLFRPDARAWFRGEPTDIGDIFR